MKVRVSEETITPIPPQEPKEEEGLWIEPKKAEAKKVDESKKPKKIFKKPEPEPEEEEYDDGLD
jgi:hypothetical protein